METLDLVQGSKEWLAIRGKYCVASEAPIMMGASPNMSRDDLLKYKTTGSEQEITRFQQLIFDEGHETEALARPIAEAKIGEDLYPVTGVTQLRGLWFLASFDGLTMLEDDHWEHKQFNKDLFYIVSNNLELPPKIYWQLEHQLLVNGNDSCAFTVSDGTEVNCADCRYSSIPERREQLIGGWIQFEKDKENYIPIVVPPKAVAEIEETLPALTYKTNMTEKGLALTSNLVEYKAGCVAMVERSKKKMETDQDFANAENRIKICKEQEEFLAMMQTRALSEVSDLDKFSRDLAEIAKMLRECRLNEEKQVDSRKTEIRTDIINASKKEFDLHLKAVNDAIAASGHGFSLIALPVVAIDLAGAIKGKRTIKTLQEAANNEVFRAKVEANRIAGIIDANLDLMKKTAADYAFLFADYAFLFADIRTLIVKDQDDLKAIVINRIADHKRQEDDRIAAEAQKIADKAIADQKAADAKKLADEQTEKAKSVQPAITITRAGVTEEEQLALYPEIEKPLVIDPMEEYLSGAPVHDVKPVQQATEPKAAMNTFSYSREGLIKGVANWYRVTDQQAEDMIIKVFCKK